MHIIVTDQSALRVKSEKVEKKEDAFEKLQPVNKVRGWHFSNEYVDDDNNVFKKGKFIGNDPTKTPTSKKA